MSREAASGTGRNIGWMLLVALAFAVAIAISLAVQWQPERAAPEPAQCGGLYTECCLEWDDDWGPCIDDDCDDPEPRDSERRDEGLFDAEANFADNRRPATC